MELELALESHYLKMATSHSLDAHKKYKAAKDDDRRDEVRTHHATMKTISEQAGFSELKDFITHSEQELNWGSLLDEQSELSKELKKGCV